MSNDVYPFFYEEKKHKKPMQMIAEFEKKFKKREESMNEERYEFEEYEDEKHENEVNSIKLWETELDEKVKESEKAIVARAERLEKAAERYAAERKLWEEVIKNNIEAPVNYETEFREIREAYIMVCETLENTRKDLANARNAVCNSFNDGILELCKLYRDMCLSDDMHLKQKADDLSVILIKEFGAFPIDPVPGTEYCGELHEKLDFNQNGDVIASCCIRGWSYKDKVLMRAVVEIKEGGNW